MNQHPRHYAAMPFHYAGTIVGWIAAWLIIGLWAFWKGALIQLMNAKANAIRRGPYADHA